MLSKLKHKGLLYTTLVCSMCRMHLQTLWSSVHIQTRPNTDRHVHIGMLLLEWHIWAWLLSKYVYKAVLSVGKQLM